MADTFTEQVQNEVDAYCKELLNLSDNIEKSFYSGIKYRDFLNDSRYLNTSDFVIRRFLQKRDSITIKKIEVETGKKVSNLIEGLNTEWPVEVISELATELEKLSENRKARIDAEEWIKYLSIHRNITREGVFKIAFILRMNPKETQELLLSVGQNKYCMRNPEDLIYYFCQQRQNSYQWETAVSLIDIFNKHRESASFDPNSKGRGSTSFWTMTINELIELKKSEEEVQKILIEKMITRCNDFISLEITNYEYFMRFAKILAVVYPFSFDKRKRYKPSYDNNEIKLSSLVSAMYSNNAGWLPSSISVRDENKKRSGASYKRRNMPSDIQSEIFYKRVQVPIDNLTNTVAAYKRTYSESKNCRSIDRESIILFSYFYIIKCEELHNLIKVDSNADRQMMELEEALNKNRERDNVARVLFDVKNRIECECIAEEIQDTGAKYRKMINDILDLFNMQHIYIPCAFDRFIYFCLFCGEISSFISAVMNDMPDEITREQSAVKKTNDLYDSLNKLSPYLLCENNGEKIWIKSADFYIGRKTGSADEDYYNKADYEIMTNDRSIPKLQTRIAFDGNGFYIVDISDQPFRAKVNEKEIEPNSPNFAKAPLQYVRNKTDLMENDIIQIGDFKFVFKFNVK